ncbi:iron uptake protein [Hydrogenophaga sp. D2P1]|uniref:Iron uptake protein n=1 Tax=Hydrogenophaga aromaticivorans TaxID=2610898 RepID=A0A7Y8GYG5_9BURK|nr:iron uptake protein [Hydrogenophaga aromaticivorans]NWF46856.1 iron uptake protein [Hydrogenophaga aromaticivorans]
MKHHTLRWPAITARVAAGVFGGYAFTWGFAAAGVAALVGLGVEYHDAETGVLMLAFLLFLGLFLWSFTATSLLHVWTVLAGGAALLFTAAWAIQRAILA